MSRCQFDTGTGGAETIHSGAVQPLPIDAIVPRIVTAVRRDRRVIVVAPAGSGKTTRIPPALTELGRVILLQPRRVAARNLARRIASERSWTIGEEVGWQVRFEKKFTSRTRLLVATEGILTARLQTDPLLSDFHVIVLDEFHERSIHADVGIALAREAFRARDDLSLVVMSATIDPAAVSEYLDQAPVVTAEGRVFPVEIVYRPELTPAAAIRSTLESPGGDVLCFLPGAPEIRRVAEELGRTLLQRNVKVLPLHGGLSPDEQDAALAPAGERKVILSTNIAETSLTVEGVGVVIDSGLQKVLRYDVERGIDHLVTERISRDSADQRAGRAGRLSAGTAIRLWDARDLLAPQREPEIRRIDLSTVMLELLSWGADPQRFEWFETPPEESVRRALELLERLGAVRDGKLTKRGEAIRRLPLHPRLATLLVETGGSRRAAAACAIVSEGGPSTRRPNDTTASDLLTYADQISSAPYSVRQAARELERIAALVEGGRTDESDEALLRAVLAAYPDRVARRREGSSDRYLLASGLGAVLARESGVRDAEYLVAVELTKAPNAAEAIIRVASRIEKTWLTPTAKERRQSFDRERGTARAVEVDLYGVLVLTERPVKVDDETREAALAEELLANPGERAHDFLRRARFAGVELDLPTLAREAVRGARSLAGADLVAAVLWAVKAQIDKLAPVSLEVPSGRRVALEYRDDGAVVASVKLQELFGLADSPAVGPQRTKVTFALLAPNGRPVQMTSDLRSFWERTYPEVRKELRGRYPKHPWPDDPWNAVPTAKTKRR